MGSMVIAVLEMMLPRGNEAVTISALRALWDTTCARPGCVGGGVFQKVGRPETALYIEMWQEAARLEVHIRSQTYQRLLALMDTAAACPTLRFNFVAETRGLPWVEQLRLGTTDTAGDGE
jgi:quinol monooxygenase YgiN